MKKPLLFIAVILLTINVYAQNNGLHYIKIMHIGEQIMPVHPLNISFGDGTVPRDSAEMINDTLQVISVVTDEKSFEAVNYYLDHANFRLKPSARLDFGTFKIITDEKRFYLPDISVTPFFKKMITYLKNKQADPQLVSAIIDNYPWIFNP